MADPVEHGEAAAATAAPVASKSEVAAEAPNGDAQAADPGNEKSGEVAEVEVPTKQEEVPTKQEEVPLKQEEEKEGNTASHAEPAASAHVDGAAAEVAGPSVVDSEVKKEAEDVKSEVVPMEVEKTGGDAPEEKPAEEKPAEVPAVSNAVADAAVASGGAAVAVPGAPVVPGGVETPGKRKRGELVMTAFEAQEKARKLPKGVVLEPVAQDKVALFDQPLGEVSGKRRRAPSIAAVQAQEAAEKAKLEKEIAKTPGRGRPKKQQIQAQLDQVESQLKELDDEEAEGAGTAASGRPQRATAGDPNYVDEADDSNYKTPRPTTKRGRTLTPATPASTPGTAQLQGPLKKCNDIIRKLLNHKFGWVFAVPVDPVLLNIPTYFDVIKNPMDLGTVRDRLASGHYTDVVSIEEDVHLTFDNALTFNPPGSDVHTMATVLKKEFTRLFEKVPRTPIPAVPAFKTPTPAKASPVKKSSASRPGRPPKNRAVDSSPPSSANDDMVAKLQAELTQMRSAMSELIKEVKGHSTSQANLRDDSYQSKTNSKTPQPAKNKRTPSKAKTPSSSKKSKATPAKKEKTTPKAAKAKTTPKAAAKAKAPAVKEMNYNQKKELSDLIGELDDNQTEIIHTIILNNVKMSSQEDEEMEIDIDVLPAKVLWTLNDKLKEFIGKGVDTEPVAPVGITAATADESSSSGSDSSSDSSSASD